MIVRISKRAEKELDALLPAIRVEAWKHIRSLITFPYPRQAAKLKGSEDTYRIRIGSYRILYIMDKKQITIMRIRHRREVYR